MKTKFKVENFFQSKKDFSMAFIPTPFIIYENLFGTREFKFGIHFLCWQVVLETTRYK